MDSSLAGSMKPQVFTKAICAFSGGTNARAILEYSMSDKASADRAAVKETMAQGQSFEEASAQFLSDECFEAWYQDTLASLEAFQG